MYEKETAKLLEWVEEHERSKGEYLSNAHHPIWGVANRYLLPHTFHYYGIILSYLNLWKATKKKQYLQKAEDAGQFLCSLQKSSGQFNFDTFEFNTPHPTGLTLIHNALPSIALLKLYKETKNERYRKVAKKNINWWFCRLWNGKYLTGCINQDVVAAEALAELYSVEKKEIYRKRAERIAHISLQLQVISGEHKGSFIRGFRERDLIIPWYDALTAVSYLNISELLENKKYKESAQATALWLRKQMTNQGLIHWYIKKEGWIQVREPVLIAPTGIVLELWDRLKMKVSTEMLKHQEKNGAFPLASWYGDERTEPNLGWNQWMLLFLTRKVKKELPKVQREEKNRKIIESMKRSQQLKVYSLRKKGYVDVIKDHFTIKSIHLDNRKATLPEVKKSILRIRMEHSLWRTIKPNKTFLRALILPYAVIFPYRLAEGILTRMLQMNAEKSIVELITKLRVWRK